MLRWQRLLLLLLLLAQASARSTIACCSCGIVASSASFELPDLSAHHPLLLVVRLLDGHREVLRLHLLLRSEDLSLRRHHLLVLELRLALRVLRHVRLHLLLSHHRRRLRSTKIILLRRLLLWWHLRVVLRARMVTRHPIRRMMHDLRLHLMMRLHLHGRPALPRWPLIISYIHSKVFGKLIFIICNNIY